MAQLSQDINFADDELFFALGHGPIVDLLPHEDFTILFAADFENLTKTAFANLLYNFILSPFRRR